mmetsp:Transcript_12139/g.18200  ORF Transcript_12139/g.18200 Transcript_12139/m.18200 type:complete len:520 (-) Transcript_12139:123-1682(-)
MIWHTSLLFALFLGSLQGASSFSISGGGLLLSTRVRIGKNMHTPTILRESAYSEDIVAKKDTARSALEKMLENQRKSLQETEELIRNLEADNSPVDGSKPNTITQTVLSGVNYGFVSRSEGSASSAYDLTNETFEGHGPPPNAFSLGKQQFIRNWNAIKGEYKDEEDISLTAKQKKLQEELESLSLSSAAIWEREEARGEVVAPWVIKIPYYVLCYLMDVVFEDRYIFSRFFFLETVARMPYFSYITMLHLYETLGFWRRSSEQKRVHFAEEWNEFHHLLIMESLGGDQAWWVRFLAQHSALVYFLVLTHLFALSPSLSYKFSEMLETHAVDTYSQFLDENEEKLKRLPPSLEALEYYTVGMSDPMFGEYQTSAILTGADIRKSGKDMKTLYDVFVAIREDEGDHVGTMKACLDPRVPVLSPALEGRVLTSFALASLAAVFLTMAEVPTDMVSTEFFEGIDGTLLDGVIGGAAALFGDIGDTGITEAEEELVTGGSVAFLANYIGQVVIPYLVRFLPFL